MWGRWCEIAFGLWLLASPWVVPGSTTYRWSCIVCGATAILFAAASFRRRWHLVHLATLGVAAWLMLHGWLGTRGEGNPPAPQNEILVGLVLATFAIVPSEAFRPSLPWRHAHGRPGARADEA